MELKHIVKKTIKNYQHLHIILNDDTLDDIFNYHNISNPQELITILDKYITEEHFIYYEDALNYLLEYDCSLLGSLTLISELYQDLNNANLCSTTLANHLLHHYATQELPKFIASINSLYHTQS